ncbi:MAG: Ltp family lipoprotein [Beutenbergiaceae bacterium]
MSQPPVQPNGSAPEQAPYPAQAPYSAQGYAPPAPPQPSGMPGYGAAPQAYSLEYQTQPYAQQPYAEQPAGPYAQPPGFAPLGPPPGRPGSKRAMWPFVVIGVAVVAILASLVVVGLLLARDPEPIAGPAPSTASEPAGPTGAPTSAAPTQQPTSPPAPEPTSDPAGLTQQQLNAVELARSYLRSMAFSRDGLIGQLEYEGFATDDATIAVDSLNVDWFEQAVLSAEEFLMYTDAEGEELIDLLIFVGFTVEQAEYGVSQASA